jgi:hypothetical protein
MLADAVSERMQQWDIIHGWAEEAVGVSASILPDEFQRKWARICEPVSVAAGLGAHTGWHERVRRAPPHPAKIRALAVVLDRIVLLLHSGNPRGDPLDRRGLVYVFHPEHPHHQHRTFFGDEDLRELVLADYPADAFAWGNLWCWWTALDEQRRKMALVLVYDAAQGRYAGTRVASPSGISIESPTTVAVARQLVFDEPDAMQVEG